MGSLGHIGLKGERHKMPKREAGLKCFTKKKKKNTQHQNLFKTWKGRPSILGLSLQGNLYGLFSRLQSAWIHHKCMRIWKQCKLSRFRGILTDRCCHADAVTDLMLDGLMIYGEEWDAKNGTWVNVHLSRWTSLLGGCMSTTSSVFEGDESDSSGPQLNLVCSVGREHKLWSLTPVNRRRVEGPNEA